jgi:hypothetical protein
LSGNVYRVALPRTDLAVTSQGVAINPGLPLGGYAAFTRYPETTMLMGDLVVTEAEVPKLTDVLQGTGIAQTALHKHLPQQGPAGVVDPRGGDGTPSSWPGGWPPR